MVLTDGISPGGDYPGLTRRMRDANITLSTIGIGNDADFNLLQQLADQGSGRYYEGSDPFQVPQILVKETLEVARTAIVEEPFRPAAVGSSPMLDGIDPRQLPVSQGYVSLTPKSAALVVLGTGRATRCSPSGSSGSGRSWPGRPTSRTAGRPTGWSGRSSAASGARSSSGPCRPGSTRTCRRPSTVEGERATVAVESLNDDRSFRNFLPTSATLVAPDGRQSELRLDQVGPGRYEGLTPLGPPGAYLVQAVQRSPDGSAVVATQATGFVTNVVGRVLAAATNRELLARARARDRRRRAGQAGRRLRPQPARARRRPGAGPWLTAAAVALFLVDVAVRRLRVSTAAAERAWRPPAAGCARPGGPRRAGRARSSLRAGAGGRRRGRPAAARLMAAKQRGAAAATAPTGDWRVAWRRRGPPARRWPPAPPRRRRRLRRGMSGAAPPAVGAAPATSSSARGAASARLLAAKQRARSGRDGVRLGLASLVGFCSQFDTGDELTLAR